jgi:protein-tyrosine phosphatase
MVPDVADATEYRTHWIELAGAHNVRDVAGLTAGEHRVRPGVLLRSDHLDSVTDDDLGILRDQLGLRAVIDLRTAEEAPAPAGWIATMGVARLHLPLIDLSGTTRPGGLRDQFATDPAQAYRTMLEEAAPGITRILGFLLEDDHVPAMIHCAAGKDRTGITIAVLLAAAGVDEPGIIADYVATGERLTRIRRALAQREFYKHLADAPPESTLAPKAIEGVLEALRGYDDGAAGFLIAQGATTDQIGQWRQLLLDTGAG